MKWKLCLSFYKSSRLLICIFPLLFFFFFYALLVLVRYAKILVIPCDVKLTRVTSLKKSFFYNGSIARIRKNQNLNNSEGTNPQALAQGANSPLPPRKWGLLMLARYIGRYFSPYKKILLADKFQVLWLQFGDSALPYELFHCRNGQEEENLLIPHCFLLLTGLYFFIALWFLFLRG